MEQNEIHFIDRTIRHIRRVQDNMILLAKNFDELNFEKDKQYPNIKLTKWDLIRRAMKHDLSKFDKRLVNGFVKANESHRAKRLGLETDITFEDIKPFITRHREIEDHHFHNFILYVWEPINLDICEMCCDLAAMAQEFGEEDYTQYFREKLWRDAPLVNIYSDDCIRILELLQTLNKKNDN